MYYTELKVFCITICTQFVYIECKTCDIFYQNATFFRNAFITSLPSPPHPFHRICLLFCPQGFFCIFAHSAHSMLIKPPYRRFKGVLSLGNLLYFCSLTSAIGDLKVFCLQGFFCIFAHSAHWGFKGVLYLISLSNLLYGI